MPMRWRNVLVAGGVAVLAAQAVFAQTERDVVGGKTPHKRPDNAPTITESKKTDAQLKKALTGINKPYTGLQFLDDQGAWYTPFEHPGATPPYDIRQWHKDQ